MKNLRNITIALIVAFIAINAFRSDKDPKTTAANTKRSSEKGIFNVDQNVDLQDLKYAYTGNWDKNAPYKPEDKYTFNHPKDTRNQAAPAKKQTKKDTKKKKTAAKKKPFKYKKYSKNSSDRSQSRGGYTNPYSNFANNLNAKAKEDEKLLSVDEWFNIILAEKEKGIYKLIHDYEAQLVDTETFYSILDKLIASDDDSLRRLAYVAFGSTPSVASFEKHVLSLKEETSSDVKKVGQSALQVYNQIQNIRFLNFALNNLNTDVRVTSSTMIKEVVLKAIQSVQSGTADDTTRNPAVFSEQSIAKYRVAFAQTLTILNSILTNGSVNGQVASNFTDTRASLVQFLG